MRLVPRVESAVQTREEIGGEMRTLTDEEIVSVVLADRTVSKRERELAKRLGRLLHTLDTVEEALESDLARGEIWHGSIH